MLSCLGGGTTIGAGPTPPSGRRTKRMLWSTLGGGISGSESLSCGVCLGTETTKTFRVISGTMHDPSICLTSPSLHGASEFPCTPESPIVVDTSDPKEPPEVKEEPDPDEIPVTGKPSVPETAEPEEVCAATWKCGRTDVDCSDECVEV